MANEDRGEFAVTLAGIDYEMRATYEAIQAFEGVDGLQLTQLAVAASRGGLSVTACAVIVAETVRAWGKEHDNTSARGFQADAVGPLLVAEGISSVQTVLAKLLFLAATGGLDASGKRKAQASKSPTEESGGASAGSPAPRSAGARKTSGARRR